MEENNNFIVLKMMFCKYKIFIYFFLIFNQAVEKKYTSILELSFQDIQKSKLIPDSSLLFRVILKPIMVMFT